MLKLIGISKTYNSGNKSFHALDDINLEFEKNELVAILGQSGSGKTTLLNIIGGLDMPSNGKFIIENNDAKNFKAKDWDFFRNKKIGYVFQNYNLISHINVFDNVAMTLCLSGKTKKQRAKLTKIALEKVGLADQSKKMPSQLSGGQMQRVAVARAIVNDPDIILADEPTGALDNENGILVMKLLKEISQEKLVVLVTHNQNLAETFSTRIIKIEDGKICSDSGCHAKISHEKNDEKTNTTPQIKQNIQKKKSKISMSFLTALKLSFHNLKTKKWRTIITAFASSIGIIGIALVLGMSYGTKIQVDDIQKNSLSNMSIHIPQKATIVQYNHPNFNFSQNSSFPNADKFFPINKNENIKVHTNIFSQDFLQYFSQMDKNLSNQISYENMLAMNLLFKNKNGEARQLANCYHSPTGAFSQNKIGWQELPCSKFLEENYDLLHGDKFPNSSNEVALIVDENNCINSDLLTEFEKKFDSNSTFSSSNFLNTKFKVACNNDFYKKNSNNAFEICKNFNLVYDCKDSKTLSITSIIRVKKTSNSIFLSSGLAHHSSLKDEMFANSESSEIVNHLKINSTTNPFFGTDLSNEEYNTMLSQLGGNKTPTGIRIYPVSYDAKEKIKNYLNKFNDGKEECSQIIYGDMTENFSSSISSLIDSITITLSSISSVSLLVSTIMIGIIIYVSVVERTKEIGILRSIGARKIDISRIFCAESILIGSFAGIIGTTLAHLSSLVLNSIFFKVIGIKNLCIIPFYYTLALFTLSVVLTFIGGLIPSIKASHKKPIQSLQSV